MSYLFMFSLSTYELEGFKSDNFNTCIFYMINVSIFIF